MIRSDSRHVNETVIRIVAERAGVAPDTLTRATHFRDDLNFDSLDVVEMTMSLEEAFGFSIPDYDVEGLQSVGDVIEYVLRRTHDTPTTA